jgi:butyrate kinase
MNKKPLILVINPGSTSTKLALFEGEELKKEINIKHSPEEVDRSRPVNSQIEMRTASVEKFLNDSDIKLSDLECIMARGGLLKPLKGGVYKIDKKMCGDLYSGSYGEHASNLAALIAYKISEKCGAVSYIADPVVVDELNPLARYSGHPDIERRSAFHALNQKAVADLLEKETGFKKEKSVFIVAHMGGGISIGIHEYGKITDVNNALDGEGPFTPERTGELPILAAVKYFFEKKMDYNDIKNFVTRTGGLFSYLGTTDFSEVAEKARSDSSWNEVVEAMGYQISKTISSLAAVSCGKVDAIALTGGLSYSKTLTTIIKKRVSFLAPVYLYPESEEMKALAMNGLYVLNGEREVNNY